MVCLLCVCGVLELKRTALTLKLGPVGYVPHGNFLLGPILDPFHCSFQNSMSNRLHNEPIQMRHVFNRHSLEMKFSMYQCHCPECARDTFDAGLLTMLEQETSQHASDGW